MAGHARSLLRRSELDDVRAGEVGVTRLAIERRSVGSACVGAVVERIAHRPWRLRARVLALGGDSQAMARSAGVEVRCWTGGGGVAASAGARPMAAGRA